VTEEKAQPVDVPRGSHRLGRSSPGPSGSAALATVLALLAISACARGGRDGPLDASLAPGEHEITLRHGGRNRAYLVHVPPRATAIRALPLVLALHGGGGEAEGFGGYAGLDRVADREGFLVVYPYGTGVLPRRLLTWNAGECCGYAMNQGVDDVGFLVAVLDDLARRTSLDLARVYATGHSNGAMMAYRLASERPDRVAAVVPVAGAMSAEAPAAGAAVAVLHIHSVDDPRALYDGGVGPPFPGTDVRSAHRPVETSLDRWRQRNGCSGQPRRAETRAGSVGTPEEGQTATLLVWDGCTSGRPVWHWRLTGVGHGWPGSVLGGLREGVVGPGTNLVDAAEEAWRFFAQVGR
jgi:polyhydroxybutyrate depolymerase